MSETMHIKTTMPTHYDMKARVHMKICTNTDKHMEITIRMGSATAMATAPTRSSP